MTTRRTFLKRGACFAAASALPSSAIPAVHAAGGDELHVALVGCGGRGTGAAADALATRSRLGPVKLVAMADLQPARLERSLAQLQDGYAAQLDVPADRRFVGLDAYRHAMNCLDRSDVVILATPPAFRWVHFRHAVDRGLHVFMEKAVTVDGPTSRRMLGLGEEAARKGLKVGVGLMVRHCDGRRELKKRLDGGEIGEILAMRAYRMHGPSGTAFTGPRPARLSELHFQIQRFHAFLWASGGIFSDYNIHQIDECCWMKGAWPVQAHALGARHHRGEAVDQNFDHYSVEYAFADGTRFRFDGRHAHGCRNEMASYVHGTKGSAVVSTSGHTPGRVRTFKGHRMAQEDVLWAQPQPERNPYGLEWEHLIQAIRNGEPYDELKRGVEASLVCSMGRKAAHTGRVVTFQEMLEDDHEFAPGLDRLADDSPAPVQPGPDGRYPAPEPGRKGTREY